MLLHSELTEKDTLFSFSHLMGVSLMMEKKVTLNPVAVSFFSAVTEVVHSESVADLIKQSEWLHGRLPALLDFLFRLPIGKLSLCFYDTSAFYTPENPDCYRAFRVSTYSWAS
jgi:hypothetical protein